jgi:conjugal transfer/entry exclusion protein
MYKALTKKNGIVDPLRKTLIIIDEAHKLYGETDLSHLERPDMDAFKESILRSYEISGADSVRLILMTATPITKYPMELVKLINLCKERHHRMEEDFHVFSEEYLDETGKFSGRGESRFLDNISGHISYLNREKDARMFAQPVIKFIDVPLLENQILHREYDAPLLRALEKPRIDELEKQIKEDLAMIPNKYKGITAKSFASINDVCETLPKKKERTACKKLARQAIKDVMEYVKERKKEVKEEGKELRQTLKEAKATLKAKTDEIKMRIKTVKNMTGGNGSEEDSNQKFREKQPIHDVDTDYQKYIQSAFYNVRTKCRIPAKRNVFNDYPAIVRLKEENASFNDAIEDKKKDLKDYTKNLKSGFREMKKVLQGNTELLTLKKKEMKEQISGMAIETRRKIDEFNKQIVKRDRKTKKMKATLERKYKKSLKQKEKDLKEINREMEKVNKGNQEFQDFMEIEEEDLREYVKNRYHEFREELKK